jgi:predicted ArsR family transcriptional regulator
MSHATVPPATRRTPNSARQAVLVALRRIGPASPDALASELGISRGAALSELRTLETVGLVVRGVERHGVGRPRHRYDLTDAAQSLLPSNYAGLATGLLDALLTVSDASVVAALFAVRRERQAALIRDRFAKRGLELAPLSERVCELAVIQDEQGYLCDCSTVGGPPVEAVGPIRLREANCAIYDVAQGHPEACAAELDLFREVLGAEVVRESHIAAGDRTCTYRIDPIGHG